MSRPSENIEAQALKLPPDERARVALHLLDSLEQQQSTASREAIEREWINESVRRLEVYRRGEMEAYPAEDVIADLEKPAD